jgi:hypothetical protein
VAGWHVNFFNAKQAKQTNQYKTRRKDCKRPTRQNDITKYAEKNS